MSTRIEQLFQKKKKVLSIYFTAGYPKHSDTLPILESLQEKGWIWWRSVCRSQIH